ncbi:MAG TPA: hypothetical protein VFY81_01415 [Gammaproteobacteria bacterium]|jgi:uncharacterized membrane protein|nr:hypothetical protein [Gammaproteobacteria bacterium]
MKPEPQLLPSEAEERSLRMLTHAVYGLQALAFLTLVTPLVGVVINYVKREDAAGTFYDSHFRWQIRTFWWSLLWGAVGVITLLILIGKLILLAVTVWYIYRIVKGWLRLIENKPMY